MSPDRHARSSSRGLAWATTAALVLTAVLPVLLLSALATGNLQRALTTRATDDLSMLAEAQAGRLQLIATAAGTHARLVASRTQLRRDLAALLDGDRTRRGRIDDILTDTVAATSEVLAVALLDVDGVLRAGAPDLVDGANALGLRPADLTDEAAVWSTTVTTDRLDRWLLLTPLHLDERVLGIAVIELDLSPVAAVMHRPTITAMRTCVSQVGADGRVEPLRFAMATGTADCDAHVLIDAADAGPTAPAALAAIATGDGPRAVEGVAADGVHVLVTGRLIEDPGWLVTVAVSRDELLSPVRVSTWLLVGAAALIGVVAGLIAVLLARRITRPIIRLRDTVHDLEDGDLRARADPVGPGELGELARGVNRMAEAIEEESLEREQRYRDLEVLTHAMAHDLKGPLTTIHGMLELMADDRVRDERQRDELLERARCASVRMQRLIADLLTLIRAHGTEPSLEPIPLGEVVDRAIEDLEVAGLVERDELPTVPGDRILLEHVVQNLLSNAVVYHAADVRPRVVVSAVAGEGTVEVHVDDAGVGIPVAEREEVLALFFRGERTRRTRGTGLGLPIAVRAVERLGGRIRIEDSPLGGTRMVVSLPSERPVAPGA